MYVPVCDRAPCRAHSHPLSVSKNHSSELSRCIIILQLIRVHECDEHHSEFLSWEHGIATPRYAFALIAVHCTSFCFWRHIVKVQVGHTKPYQRSTDEQLFNGLPRPKATRFSMKRAFRSGRKGKRCSLSVVRQWGQCCLLKAQPVCQLM